MGLKHEPVSHAHQIVKGSCLCGAVAFEVDSDQILLVNNCHCVNCRKSSGAAYGTMVQVTGSGFRWLRGADHIRTYESSPGIHRGTCTTCGSRTPQSVNFQEQVSIPAGLFDDPFTREPDVNMWADQKASWHTLEKHIPQCEGRGSPEFWATILGKSPEFWRRIQEERDGR